MKPGHDAVELKKLFEAGPVFKAAGPKDLKQRKNALGKPWLSIRVVLANNEEQAVEQVVEGNFEETHPLCDVVLPASDVKVNNKSGSTWAWTPVDQMTEASKPIFRAAGQEDMYKRAAELRAKSPAITPENKALAQLYWKTVTDIEYELAQLREQYGLDDEDKCECEITDSISFPDDYGSIANYCLKCGGDAGSRPEVAE